MIFFKRFFPNFRTPQLIWKLDSTVRKKRSDIWPVLTVLDFHFHPSFHRYTTIHDTQPYMIIILSLTLEKKTSEHHIPIIPVDAEAVSVTSQTTERARCTLYKCRDQNFLTDTFTVDHLLSKLSSSIIGVLACK